MDRIACKRADRAKNGNFGFTLIELLGSLAVIALVLALTAMAAGLGRASRVSSTVNGIAELLSEARSYAMARNTWVWVKIESDDLTGAQISILEDSGIRPVVPSEDARPLAKIRKWSNVAIAEAVISEETISRDSRGASQLSTGQMVLFHPSGEVHLNGEMPRLIEIGLVGLVEKDAAAVVQISALTGRIQVKTP
jgi:prepilin-type N-terminal cleavage/methylation domain-containing protein